MRELDQLRQDFGGLAALDPDGFDARCQAYAAADELARARSESALFKASLFLLCLGNVADFHTCTEWIEAAPEPAPLGQVLAVNHENGTITIG